MDEGWSSFGPGTVIGGKFRLDAVIGRGNMGLVAAAWDLAMERRVAIKLMAPGRIAEEQRERFVREARTAAKLRSEHVVKVLEVSLAAAAPFLVMEYLEGRDLAAELVARGPLPVEDAVEYVLQACEALGEAHAAGIVHRDVKPANLFLTRAPGGTPLVKVVDFGIARLGKDSHLTQEGKAIGSPTYMAPEQMRAGLEADGRSDIWSLGVTLYELLAGSDNTPFAGADLPSVATHVHLDPPVPLSQYRPDAPPQLWAIIQQCLEKPRERRWPTCAELAAALVPHGPPRAAQYADRVAATLGAEVAPSRPTDVLGHGPAPSAKTVAATATTGTGTAVVQPRQPAPARRRILAAAAAVTVLAGVGLVGWRAQLGASHPATAGSATAEITAARPPEVPAPPVTEADAGAANAEADAGAPAPAVIATATEATPASASPDGGAASKDKPQPAGPAAQPKTKPAKPPATTYQL